MIMLVVVQSLGTAHLLVVTLFTVAPPPMATVYMALILVSHSQYCFCGLGGLFYFEPPQNLNYCSASSGQPSLAYAVPGCPTPQSSPLNKPGSLLFSSRLASPHPPHDD